MSCYSFYLWLGINSHIYKWDAAWCLFCWLIMLPVLSGTNTSDRELETWYRNWTKMKCVYETGFTTSMTRLTVHLEGAKNTCAQNNTHWWEYDTSRLALGSNNWYETGFRFSRFSAWVGCQICTGTSTGLLQYEFMKCHSQKMPWPFHDCLNKWSANWFYVYDRINNLH